MTLMLDSSWSYSYTEALRVGQVLHTSAITGTRTRSPPMTSTTTSASAGPEHPAAGPRSTPAASPRCRRGSPRAPPTSCAATWLSRARMADEHCPPGRGVRHELRGARLVQGAEQCCGPARDDGHRQLRLVRGPRAARASTTSGSSATVSPSPSRWTKTATCTPRSAPAWDRLGPDPTPPWSPSPPRKEPRPWHPERLRLTCWQTLAGRFAGTAAGASRSWQAPDGAGGCQWSETRGEIDAIATTCPAAAIASISPRVLISTTGNPLPAPSLCRTEGRHPTGGGRRCRQCMPGYEPGSRAGSGPREVTRRSGVSRNRCADWSWFFVPRRRRRPRRS